MFLSVVRPEPTTWYEKGEDKISGLSTLLTSKSRKGRTVESTEPILPQIFFTKKWRSRHTDPFNVQWPWGTRRKRGRYFTLIFIKYQTSSSILVGNFRESCHRLYPFRSDLQSVRVIPTTPTTTNSHPTSFCTLGSLLNRETRSSSLLKLLWCPKGPKWGTERLRRVKSHT